MPDPILVGRNEEKLKAIAGAHGVTRWTHGSEARTLTIAEDTIYFDSGATGLREQNVLQAIAAGKHVYCEKPLATTLKSAMSMARAAEKAGVKHGVVQDKLFLPGIRKLRRLIDAGFFGRILSVRGEFGYWVFEGDRSAAAAAFVELQEGRGWRNHSRYVLPLALRARPHLRRGAGRLVHGRDAHSRARGRGGRDAINARPMTRRTACSSLEGGIFAQINSSWATRVYRDELLSLQVDGTEGSAVAGLRECKVQHRVNTPRPVWNPDLPNPFQFRELVGRGPRQRRVRQRVQSAVGDVSAPRGGGRAVSA